MAREFAKMRMSMWTDDDFRDLDCAEQHLYWVLMGSQTLSYCGVADWRPTRIAPLARGWTAEQVVATAAGLVDKLYLVVDESTEEVLVRSFIRHDEILKQPKLSVAMVRAHALVSSAILRGVIVHELNRLHEEEPDLKGWGEKAVKEALSRASVDPTVYPLGKGHDWPSVRGSVWGNASPADKSPGNPLDNPPSTTFNLQPSTSNPQTSDSLRSSGASAPPKRSKPRKRLPVDWQPTEAHREYATQNGIDLAHEMAQFRAHADANDRQQADWDATFRTWLGNCRKWDRPRSVPAAESLPAVDGFQLPAAPKSVMDDPDPKVYVRWARAQRDAWLAEQDRSPA